MVLYKHSLSKGIVSGLVRLHSRSPDKPINLKEIGLNRNQWDNFQKLKYWDLVTQVEVDGKKKKGIWVITERGVSFLMGEVSVNKSVWTYRGEFKKYDGDMITIYDVSDVAYKQREEYADEASALKHQKALDDYVKEGV
jgi:hypothetical protein